jgi:hypothetical protein
MTGESQRECSAPTCVNAPWLTEPDGRRVCGMCASDAAKPGVADTTYADWLFATNKLLRAEVARLRSAISDIAQGDCHYGDNCPAGSRHGRCVPCRARDALRRGLVADGLDYELRERDQGVVAPIDTTPNRVDDVRVEQHGNAIVGQRDGAVVGHAGDRNTRRCDGCGVDWPDLQCAGCRAIDEGLLHRMQAEIEAAHAALDAYGEECPRTAPSEKDTPITLTLPQRIATLVDQDRCVSSGLDFEIDGLADRLYEHISTPERDTSPEMDAEARAAVERLCVIAKRKEGWNA